MGGQRPKSALIPGLLGSKAANCREFKGFGVGNGIDRLAYGAVVDFVLLHAETATWAFNWYVFNFADVAIVAGVAGLLYESFWGESAPKAP